MKESMNILEFQRRFRTEEDCIAAIVRKRWPDGFVCPHCRSAHVTRLAKRRAFQCNACLKQTSITAGTIFEKTRIPLLNWFFMMFLMANDKGGVSATRISNLLNMRYDTVWHILEKLRIAMGERDELYQLCGSIEIDEAYFGGRERRGGRRGWNPKKKTAVLVLAESKGDRAGALKMKVIEGRVDMYSIKELVEHRVEKEQFFEADGKSWFGILSAMGHRVTWRKTKEHEKDERLKWINTATSLAKRFILGTYHGVSPKHLQQYLDEFCFRWNRRSLQTGIFMRLLATASWCAPVHYSALSG